MGIADRIAPRIYGITGTKLHGKDTFAKYVKKASETESAHFLNDFSEVHILHFAEELKRQAGEIFGLTREQMNDQTLKEQPFAGDAVICLDDFLDDMRKVTGIDSIRSHPECLGRTPREVLQFFGTNYVRRERDSYWIDCLEDKIKALASAAIVIVPDTRFLNEGEVIRKLGGVLVRVVKLDAVESTDNHLSEREMNKLVPDLVLGAKTGELAELEKVAWLVACGLWECARLFDQRIRNPEADNPTGPFECRNCGRSYYVAIKPGPDCLWVKCQECGSRTEAGRSGKLGTRIIVPAPSGTA